MLSWDLGVKLLSVDFVSVGEANPLPNSFPRRVHWHDVTLQTKNTLLHSIAITRLGNFY